MDDTRYVLISNAVVSEKDHSKLVEVFNRCVIKTLREDLAKVAQVIATTRE